MKHTDIHGIGNALVDIPVQIPPEALADLSFTAGSSRLIDADEQRKLLDYVNQRYSGNVGVLTAAGSVANSVITVAELGGASGLSARVADDQYGRFYEQELARLNVKLGNPLVVSGASGTSVVLITPDGERTMRTALGVSSDMSPGDIDKRLVQDARWIFVEGYLFANGDAARDAIEAAVGFAKEPAERNRSKVALTLSDASIVKAFKSDIEKILDRTDLIFANKSESMAFTGTSSPEAALQELRKIVPSVVVTAGSKGAYVFHDGRESFVPANPCTPIDTTGAGDAFAGGFLYGITNGYSAEESARGGSMLASKVIQVYGARLANGVREAWAASQKP